ncbi:MAG: peptidase MA family metallohydrolase [Bacillota bacterium]|nr:peptidase MA family metallohydrolase [Bacillota bacterium]
MIKSAVANIYGSIERNRLERITTGYLIKDTENFRIKFSSEDLETVDRVAGEAERQLALAADYFGYQPKDKITIIVYPNKEDLEKGLRLSSGGTTLGAYYAGTISIISPKKWGIEGQEAEKGLYLHELTHLIMDDMAGGNYPVWFTEGLALYQEYLATGFEWGKDYIFKEQPYTVRELTLQFNKLDQFLAYKQSFLIVKEIMERSSIEEVLALFQLLKKGQAFETAFARSLGYSLSELQQ